MISKKLEVALNEQVNREMQAAYSYFAMAVYCDSRSLDGFSNWMKIQAQEEMAHAMKLYNYLNDVDATITLEAVPRPEQSFQSLLDVFKLALKNEEDFGRLYNEISSLALEERDNTTYNFLKWFLDEQVEEVSMVKTVLDKLKLIGESGNGIFMLNDEFAKRVYVPSAE